MLQITRIKVDPAVADDLPAVLALFPGPRKIRREWFRAIFRELTRELKRQRGRINEATPLMGRKFAWEFLPRRFWVSFEVDEKVRWFATTTTITILGLSPFDPTGEETDPD